MTDVVVVGAGLAGLVAARRLAPAGNVTVFERESEVGGRVRSDHEDGFVFDHGFQVLFPNYPAVEHELDLDALDLCAFRPGAIIARPGERSTLADPLRDPATLSATVFNHNATLRDKLRVLKLRRDMARKSTAEIMRNDGQSIADFLADRGFSRGFREAFFAPFYGGITLNRSLSSSRLVFEYTFKMLTTGNATVPEAGMGQIPAQLVARAREAGVTIETETPVGAVTPEGPEPDESAPVTVETAGETIEADAVVVATDPKRARALTGVESIPTEGQGCVTQQFALPKTQRLDTGARLLLNAADARPNQIAPMSAVAPDYAPDETHLLSATFLGEQEASDEQLAAEVQETLASWYPEHNFAELTLRRTDRIPFAQFSQPPGFTDELPAVDAPAGSVYLAGEYTEWSSIQGALVSGRHAASAVDTT